ncbi:MAG: hypothetical protein N2043_02260 [Ignavibacterium sp.]|nr:hypothetical protein [Ignavibacterium sp.]
MPLTRIKTGKIYFTHFDETELDTFWDISPKGSVAPFSLTERRGFLRIKHNETEEPTRILFNIPNIDFVIEIRNEYYPMNEQNIGGLTAFQEIRNKIELLEYFDGSQGQSINYTHMRLKKHGQMYEGYGSKDGGFVWTLIGAKTSKEMEKIGFVLYGEPNENNEPFDIDYLSIYESTDVYVKNLEPNSIVTLLDEFGNVVDKKVCGEKTDYVRLDASKRKIPFNGRIVYVDPTKTKMLETELMEIWGGDVFYNGLCLDFYVKDQKVDIFDFYLGNMDNGVIELPVEVENPCEEPVRDIYIRVEPYKWYFGHQWVEIAQDDYGVPGDYKKEIYLGHIYPGERHYFWLRIKRHLLEEVPQHHDYKFRIIATNDDYKPYENSG